MSNKLIIGLSAPKSTLAKRFLKSKLFTFRKYNYDINDYDKFSKWLDKNKKINCFVNFAAITSVIKSNKLKTKILKTNHSSVIKIINIINKSNLVNFNYFLALSSSHVFKKKKNKLYENSFKKPDNIYGLSKLLMERDIKMYQSNFKFKIGIARIFNFYDKNSRKNFFVQDIKKKLKSKTNIIKFENINSSRDFIHPDDVIEALFHMIKNQLTFDFNVCSGKSFFLPNIIRYLNKNNKKIIFNGKKNGNLIGSNLKLQKKGWFLRNKINYNIFN